MNISMSLIGTQLVSTFIAFSKSDSRMISRMPSISAAEVACRTSRDFPNGGASGCGVDGGDNGGDTGALVVLMLVGGLEGVVGGSPESPRSMKTSQTRSWAGKGME